MYEIEFEVHRDWVAMEDALMQHVAAHVVACGDYTAPQEDGYPWTLDTRSNDWRARLDGTRLVVAYRYGGGHREMMEGLKTFLAWRLQ